MAGPNDTFIFSHNIFTLLASVGVIPLTSLTTYVCAPTANDTVSDRLVLHT